MSNVYKAISQKLHPEAEAESGRRTRISSVYKAISQKLHPEADRRIVDARPGMAVGQIVELAD